MKKIALFALAVLAVCACSQKKVADPVADAIVAEMMKDIDQAYEIRITDLQMLDSTSFATEFARRIGIYDVRLDQNTARMEKYIREGKSKNATRMFQELQRDTKIYNELNAMKEMMGADTLNTAYYDYSFTYSGKVGEQRVAPKQAFATVTPAGKVLTYSAERKDLHKATGLVIPGYKELLDSFKDTEVE
ncbi:MAG: hypothetical protein IJL93_01320 [Bacteroidales bacterium]|nr:hypothetical protein [Bacteroidales bacterium]